MEAIPSYPAVLEETQINHQRQLLPDHQNSFKIPSRRTQYSRKQEQNKTTSWTFRRQFPTTSTVAQQQSVVPSPNLSQGQGPRNLSLFSGETMDDIDEGIEGPITSGPTNTVPNPNAEIPHSPVAIVLQELPDFIPIAAGNEELPKNQYHSPANQTVVSTEAVQDHPSMGPTTMVDSGSNCHVPKTGASSHHKHKPTTSGLPSPTRVTARHGHVDSSSSTYYTSKNISSGGNDGYTTSPSSGT